MDNARRILSKVGEWALGRDAPGPASGRKQTGDPAAPAPPAARNQSFSMDKVERFFAGAGGPRANVLVSEMIDENGPLAGREPARARRKPGGVTMQFSDDDRSMLLAPNDAPDELPQQPAELDRLLRQQELRGRQRFSA